MLLPVLTARTSSLLNNNICILLIQIKIYKGLCTAYICGIKGLTFRARAFRQTPSLWRRAFWSLWRRNFLSDEGPSSLTKDLSLWRRTFLSDEGPSSVTKDLPLWGRTFLSDEGPSSVTKDLSLWQRTFLSDEGPLLETLDLLFWISTVLTPDFLYFDLYFNTAYAAHNIYCTILSI